MKKLDALLKKVELFEKLATYGDRTTFLKALSQDITPIEWGNQPQLKGPGRSIPAPPPAVPSVTLAPVTIEGTPPPRDYPPIPKETQDYLNKLLVPPGNIVPLKLDGKLGPATQKAIDIFKSKYNMPGTPQAIKEVSLRESNPEIVTKVPF